MQEIIDHVRLLPIISPNIPIDINITAWYHIKANAALIPQLQLTFIFCCQPRTVTSFRHQVQHYSSQSISALGHLFMPWTNRNLLVMNGLFSPFKFSSNSTNANLAEQTSNLALLEKIVGTNHEGCSGIFHLVKLVILVHILSSNIDHQCTCRKTSWANSFGQRPVNRTGKELKAY